MPSPTAPAATPSVAAIGDIVLDVLVEAPHGLRADDDTPARIRLAPGGQAANVAAWVAALGGAATLVGPHPGDGSLAAVESALRERGVRLSGVPVSAAGTVVALLEPGSRTLASDPGPDDWWPQVGSVPLPAGLDWLHVSSYPLLRATPADDAERLAVLQRLLEPVRADGTRVSIDLASASMLRRYGAGRFRRLLTALAPDLVFATVAEWDILGLAPADATFDVVCKDGPRGATVRSGGQVVHHPAEPVEPVDVTGAGDALAAGYLVGGPALAMHAAALCVGQLGAQPDARQPNAARRRSGGARAGTDD